KTKIVRRLISLLVVTIALSGWNLAIAKPITVTREYTYRASEADSKLSSRAIALEQVKRLLLEELGAYLVSNTEVKDSALTKDEIVAYTSGWVATVVIKEIWNGEDYFLRAKITADADEVAKAIALMHDDRDKSAELKHLQAQISDSLKEIKRLRQEFDSAKLSSKQGKTSKNEAVQKDYDLAVAKLATNADVETSFDGRWAVSLICDDFERNGSLAKGYTYDFFADVKDGKLLGQYGKTGQPASLTMIGVITKGGNVGINAHGRTANPKYSVGKLQPNTPYSYRMRGKFTQSSGKAKRIEIRPCEATFFKQ
ncbi:MAG: hypothetical protein Q7V04_12380, partial [Deltaproteobacteria bacterium]|nr:hypothetical protein [Deltaproteobacteria bacterium]